MQQESSKLVVRHERLFESGRGMREVSRVFRLDRPLRGKPAGFPLKEGPSQHDRPDAGIAQW